MSKVLLQLADPNFSYSSYSVVIEAMHNDETPNETGFREEDGLGNRSGYILEDETYKIIGAAMDVYYRLGNGFAEPVYQEALGLEFGMRGVEFIPQKRLRIQYKGITLKKGYVADFLCYDQIVVEIKALSQLTPVDWSQIMNYLKASGLRLGLLFNFGSHGRPEVKRIAV